ncbi:putative ABC transport system ATP-binding protein [Aeromicrobium sp. SORGH_AS981]|uniref:ABC transporter ATP-binding protein n=1 Tax=Aeromicrobium sp. SORGH_AS_0981 TaxID=3041802 RepID=UPI00285D96BF|nr:ABC transporter ATP-binding protein [Aeromicrobium sp. SORGH_AS_0981]MDR6120024.1 putative ABC transport system ATP-binding protein [Aeromicrobium sp. SORGH_AS_0981]
MGRGGRGTSTTSPDAPTTAPATAGALLRRALRRNGRDLGRGYPLLTLWQLSETLVPVVIGLVVDQAVDGGSLGDLAWTLGVLVALFVVLSNGYRFGARYIKQGIEREAHALRVEVAGHVLHPRGARTDRLAGETLSIATSDADLVPMALHQLGYAIASLVAVLVTAAYVLRVDVVLGLLILLGVPAVLVAIQALAPLVARRTARQQESTAAASGLAADLLEGLRPLKGIGGEDVALRRYRAASTRASDDTVAVARSWGYLDGFTTALSGLLLAAVALLAGRRALDGDISLGELIALVGLTQFLAEPLRGLGDVSAQFAASRASAARIVDFLATPRVLAPGGRAPSQDRPELVLDDVAAGPLDGLSLHLRHDELVAVAVDDPAVSDALVALLSGDLDLDSGRARLGDVDLAELSVAGRRRHLLVVSHHGGITEGTLRTTVDPGGQHDDDALAPALAASAADDVVRLHPDGLDRPVRAGGSSLSGGQRQRLALARALATDRPVVVLQDPTSAVDAVTEQAVADGVRRLRTGRTTLVLTSSPALLRAADRVLVVRGGRVVAEGTHADLLRDADYREAVDR